MQFGKRSILLGIAIALTVVSATAARAQTAMSYRFKEGDKLHYLLEQKTNSTMSLAGTDIVMKVNATLSLVGSSRVDLQACKLEYSIVSPK